MTDHICNSGNNNQNQRTNILNEFCADKINSDGLLDLIVRFGDYEKKANQNQAACLYYGITSRRLNLQDSAGIALG